MRYTVKQLEFIRRAYAKMYMPDLTRAFNTRYRCNQTEGMIRAATKNHNIKSGRDCRFTKGHKPWNTNTKGLTRANVTSFRKGSIPPNIKPLGAERIDNREGFVLKKIAECNPYTGSATRYKHKHVWLWEQKHGKVKSGMVVAFRDGNNQNCTLGNLMLITRAELLRLNQYGYKDMPDELKPSVAALVKLKIKTFERLRKDAA